MAAGSPGMRQYSSFEQWRADQTAVHQELIDALARIVETEAPHLVRTVKWGQGCWTEAQAPRVYIHAGEDHVQLGFYSGATLEDPLGLLRGAGKFVRHVRVASLEDIHGAAFAALVRQAVG